MGFLAEWMVRGCRQEEPTGWVSFSSLLTDCFKPRGLRLCGQLQRSSGPPRERARLPLEKQVLQIPDPSRSP